MPEKERKKSMKKMKKVLAMLLAMAMVLGMSMTTFAEPNTNEAKINVSGAEGEEVSYTVIKRVMRIQMRSAWRSVKWPL